MVNIRWRGIWINFLTEWTYDNGNHRGKGNAKKTNDCFSKLIEEKLKDKPEFSYKNKEANIVKYIQFNRETRMG